MILTNLEMLNFLSNLNSISDKVTGKVAYFVARNIRKISSELTEFNQIKDKYIYEKQLYDITEESQEYQDFLLYINQFIDIKHEVEISKIDAKELYNSNLTAKDILELGFMIIDEEIKED